jgi:hypothetical protein
MFRTLYYHLVTFKDLRKIIAEKNKVLERESKSYDPNYYWEGKKVISLSHWLKIKNNYGLKVALQYFPEGRTYAVQRQDNGAFHTDKGWNKSRRPESLLANLILLFCSCHCFFIVSVFISRSLSLFSSCTHFHFLGSVFLLSP